MNSLEFGLCYSIHLYWGRYREIARQTGFDSIEIELVQPYSIDYNTVLEITIFLTKQLCHSVHTEAEDSARASRRFQSLLQRQR